MKRIISPRERNVTRRQGIAALVSLACLSFSVVVGTLLMKSALVEQRYAERMQFQYQADWLVEAGVSRAAMRLAKSESYTGETWLVPASSLGGSTAAIVHIAVKHDRPGTRAHIIDVSADLTFNGETFAHSRREVRLSDWPRS